ncbi:hypothetical protein COLINT_03027 [Collinsella intestinalis DSM 13280]|uniref:Uncharacterized protein n=1 Tax=Collinsella intestinalis DSM 13280 TaxID=521003 RepID=C4FAD4_9ACTN|nr:hypothetical protein COLINT_03027 [Collinsella intestinalis DSM 13280]
MLTFGFHGRELPYRAFVHNSIKTNNKNKRKSCTETQLPFTVQNSTLTGKNLLIPVKNDKKERVAKTILDQ